MNEPEAIIENGKILNAFQLKRYWTDYWDRKALVRKEYRDIARDFPPEPLPVVERIIYHTHYLNSKDLDKINQTVLKVGHLQKKVDKLMSSRTGTFGAKYSIKE